ncbi:MAG: hypothetical protein L0K86_25830 [Actinomycetia bacterium]|nr:hypothetical protein [Actinomycetes bacterium]
MRARHQHCARTTRRAAAGHFLGAWAWIVTQLRIAGAAVTRALTSVRARLEHPAKGHDDA